MFSWFKKWFRREPPPETIEDHVRRILLDENIDEDLIAQALARARRWQANFTAGSPYLAESTIKRVTAWARSVQRLRDAQL